MTWLTLAVLPCVGCSDSSIVLASQSFRSPDDKLVATLETLDNGLGFGLGRIYEELHVLPRAIPIRGHGDSSASVVFYVDVTETAGSQVHVKWVGEKSLEVSYNASLKPGRMFLSSNGVTVKYQVESVAR